MSNCKEILLFLICFSCTKFQAKENLELILLQGQNPRTAYKVHSRGISGSVGNQIQPYTRWPAWGPLLYPIKKFLFLHMMGIVQFYVTLILGDSSRSMRLFWFHIWHGSIVKDWKKPLFLETILMMITSIIFNTQAFSWWLKRACTLMHAVIIRILFWWDPMPILVFTCVHQACTIVLESDDIYDKNEPWSLGSEALINYAVLS